MSERHRPGVKMKLYTGVGGRDKECYDSERDKIE